MTQRLRKFALTAHVTCSVGWLGAVAGFLALALAGLISQDSQMVRAAYLAMELTTWFVIVPFALASLVTGLVVSLGTQWGLFRHYWVLAKLLISVFATILLLVHTHPIGILAGIARQTDFSSPDAGRLQFQLVGDAGAALLALLVNVTLSVYKPWSLTAYGRRKVSQPIPPQHLTATRNGGDTHTASTDDTAVGLDRGTTMSKRWKPYVLLGIIGLVLLFVILHLTGGGLHGH